MTARRWLYVVWHRWLVAPAIFVVYFVLATALLTHLIYASASVQVADASLSVMIPIVIEDAKCSGACEGSFTIYCVTWQPGASSQPMLVSASDYGAAYQGLGCQPQGE